MNIMSSAIGSYPRVLEDKPNAMGTICIVWGNLSDPSKQQLEGRYPTPGSTFFVW